MKKPIIFLFSVLISALFVAGCASQSYVNNTATTTTLETGLPIATISSDIVEITTSPSQASNNSAFQVSWVARGTTFTDSTRIYYGSNHVANPSTLLYASSTPMQCSDKTCKLNYFTSAQITIAETGTYYFRAYAVINGIEYWSEEKSIVITQSTAPVAREYNVEADDNGFYMDNVQASSITVNRNDAIKLNVMVKSTGVYKGGLDFSGCGKTATAAAGQTVAIEFTPTVSCSINSYWPSTGTLKQSFSITVI